MKVHIKHWSAVAQWRWNTGSADQNDDDDVCGICRVPYEGCCPSCKMPGDDCPLSACLPVPVSLCLLCRARAESVRTPSLGRMQPHLPHALSPQMARHRRVETAVPDGPPTLGYVPLFLSLGGGRDTLTDGAPHNVISHGGT